MAKILLVEDDNNLREIYEARLQAEGYDIVSAKDGEEALVVAKKERPDLIIADVMMPRVSGFEMLDILRNTAELRDVHVIMLTALGQAEDKTRADSLGADRYLVKSQVTLEDIVKTAADVLAGAPAGAAAAAAAVDTPAPVAEVPTATIPVAAPPAVAPTTDTTTAATPPALPEPSSQSDASIPVITPPQDTAQTATPTDNTSAPATDAAVPTPTDQTSQDSTGIAPAASTQATPVTDNLASDTQLVTDAVKNLVAATDTPAADDTQAAPATPASDASTVAAPAADTPAPALTPDTGVVPPATTGLTMQPVVPSQTPPLPATPPPTPSAPQEVTPPSVTAPAVTEPVAPEPDTMGDMSVPGRKTIQPLAAGTTQAPAGLDELMAREGHTLDEPTAPTQSPPYASGPPHPPGHVISPGNTPGEPTDPNSISL